MVSGRGTPIWLYALATIFSIGVLAIVATQSDEMQRQMFRDTFSATSKRVSDDQFPPLLGVVSNIGIILWSVAWAVSGFAAIAVLRRGLSETGTFLLAISALSGILMVDDLFLLHEFVYKQYFGIGEKKLFLAYGIFAISIGYVFRSTISFAGKGLFYVALTAFAVSVVGDILDHYEHNLGLVQRWLEDGPKLIGITFWMAFALRASWVLLEFD